MELYSRFFNPPAGSFFLFGPRGTGKSTLLKSLFSQDLRIDLLDPVQFRSFTARPERLRELLLARQPGMAMLIDEIQRVPELLNVVHQLMESDRGARFVMTGSSARKLKRTGVDLLAGRAVIRSLHPFMAAELGDSFNLDTALHQGMIPLVLGAPEPADTLKAYATLYLREEVQFEGLVRNTGNFARFLEAVTFSHASMLNVSNIARECEVERKTVAGYLDVLRDLLLSFEVPVFAKRARRQLSAHPKFYLFDTGVFRAMRPMGALDRPEEVEGLALEGLIAQHLRAWSAYGENECGLYHWRTRSGLEVDFILYGPGQFWAIEVKHAARIIPRHLNSLRAFKEDYPEARAILLYRGRERLMMGDVLCLPCGDFLQALRPGKPLVEFL